MSGWQGRTALVTGATSGIGRASAQALAHAGLSVGLVGRREDRLRELAKRIEADGGRAVVVVADLGVATETARVAEEVRRACGPVQVLVNSAGAGWYGHFGTMPDAVAARLVDVNVRALVQLTSQLLPEMIMLGSGRVVNVGSILSGLHTPGTAVYAASKSFVSAFTTSLHRELRGSGVRACAVHPGPVRTEFFEVAARGGIRPPGERFGVSAERVADAVVSMLERPSRRVYVPGWMRTVVAVEPCLGWLLDRCSPAPPRAEVRTW